MTLRPSLFVAGLCALVLAAACGGDVSSDSGDGDGDAGDGDGDGDTPPVGDGDGDTVGIDGFCVEDSDCVGVWVTNAACYSPGCDVPQAASHEDVSQDPCLVEWDGETQPQPADACRDDSTDTVPCALACAQPPTCVAAYCDAGTCALITSYESQECATPGGGGAPGTDDCVLLDETREKTLEDARECIPNGDDPECTAGETISNECGCPVIVNDNRPEAVSAAQAAYDAWNAVCEPPERCSLVDCAQEGESGTCQDTGNNEGRCSF